VLFFKITVPHRAVGPIKQFKKGRDKLGTATAFAVQSRFSSKIVQIPRLNAAFHLSAK